MILKQTGFDGFSELLFSEIPLMTCDEPFVEASPTNETRLFLQKINEAMDHQEHHQLETIHSRSGRLVATNSISSGLVRSLRN